MWQLPSTGYLRGFYQKVAFEQRSRDKEETAMKISGGVPGRGRALHVKTLSWLQPDHAGLGDN